MNKLGSCKCCSLRTARTLRIDHSDHFLGPNESPIFVCYHATTGALYDQLVVPRASYKLKYLQDYIGSKFLSD
ncbi:hypothetical protein HanIR_Chr11g0515311 [Helianthus annuus]|nr:hypothetical protein HanIR_Chr11g0515311 [Helianthus annuus]